MPEEVKRCAECKFCVTQPPIPPNLTGVNVCKRFPPIPCVLWGQDRATGQPLILGGQNMQPQVAPDMFCFEFSPKDAPKLLTQ